MGELLSDFPTITVEVGFTTDLTGSSIGWILDVSHLDTETLLADVTLWTDISVYVRGFQIKRGRPSELSAIEAGTALLVLNNRDRRFEPGFAAGEYYPNVLPMRRIRIKADWEGTTYYLFSGYVEAWPQDWTNSLQDQQTVITCVDGFESLNHAFLSDTYVEQLSGDRINDILDAAGTTTSTERHIDPGRSLIQESILTNAAALGHIQEVANTEFGQFFFNGRGEPVFYDRYRRPQTTTSHGTFGDNAGELNYEDLRVSFSKDLIVNFASVTREGGITQTSSDATSQDTYFTRGYESSPLYTTDQEALNLADYIVGNYKDPRIKVTSLVVRPRLDPSNLWPHVLGRDIGDRVTTVRRPPAGGATIAGDSFIEGLTHTVTRGDWRTTWGLSPTELATGWVLDVSHLDTETHLYF
jgi:hypothetical protein